MRRTVRRESTGRGQSIVEFALVMPILLLLLMGVIEFGWMILNYVQLYNGLREGLRYGSVTGWDANNPQYYNCAGIQQRIVNFDPTANWQVTSVTIAYDAGDGSTQVGTCSPLSSANGFVACSSGNCVFPARSTAAVQEDDRIVITINVTIHYLTPIIATFIPNGLPMTFEAARTVYPNGVPLCTSCG